MYSFNHLHHVQHHHVLIRFADLINRHAVQAFLCIGESPSTCAIWPSNNQFLRICLKPVAESDKYLTFHLGHFLYDGYSCSMKFDPIYHSDRRKDHKLPHKKTGTLPRASGFSSDIRSCLQHEQPQLSKWSIWFLICFKIFFSSLETCTWDMPRRSATSDCVLSL